MNIFATFTVHLRTVYAKIQINYEGAFCRAEFFERNKLLRITINALLRRLLRKIENTFITCPDKISNLNT